MSLNNIKKIYSNYKLNMKNKSRNKLYQINGAMLERVLKKYPNERRYINMNLSRKSKFRKSKSNDWIKCNYELQLKLDGDINPVLKYKKKIKKYKDEIKKRKIKLSQRKRKTEIGILFQQVRNSSNKLNVKTKLKWNSKDKDIKANIVNLKKELKRFRNIVKQRVKIRDRIKLLGTGVNADSVTIELSENIQLSDVIGQFGFPSDDRYILLTLDNVNYVVNRENIDRIKEAIKEGQFKEENYTQSDADFLAAFKSQNEITISIQSKIDWQARRKRDDGKFFPYYCNLDYNLERYGIFKKIGDFNKAKIIKERYKYNCLQNALLHCGISNENFSYLSTLISANRIPIKYLKNIAKKLDIRIILNTYKVDKNTVSKKYGDKKKKKCYIGLIDGHYFIDDQEINITKYSLVNYEKIMKSDLRKNDWNKINYIKRNKFIINKSKASRPNSRAGILIKELLKNKDVFLEKIDLSNGLMETPFSTKNAEISSLEFTKLNFRCVEDKKLCNKKNKNIYGDLPIIFFDFETFVNRKLINNKKKYFQNPLMVCSIDENNNEKTFIGRKTCALDFLKSIKKDSLLVAHNLGFDFRFLQEHLTITRDIEKGNSIFQANCLFYNVALKKNIKLIFKDSYQMISMPLSKFGECFNLKVEKEVIPYGIYDIETINDKSYSIEYAMNWFKCKKKKRRFKANIKKWNLIINGDRFDHIKYLEIYCKKDCVVLAEGYKKFRVMMKETTDLDIKNYVSIPSIAHQYLIEKECYDGVMEVSGVVREFIQKCLVGGRVMCASNQKAHVKGLVQDFDACSLYPSAMVRMKGFLKGIPEILKSNISYNDIKNLSGYFVKINVLNIPKEYKFPLISQIDEVTGSRDFSNDVRGYVYVDKYCLEDLINFHEMKPDVDFKIIEGYSFNHGHNTKIIKVMRKLYNDRRKYKREGNSVQMIYKLLMNSSYGKTIQKPINKKKKFIKGKNNVEKYLAFNNTQILKYTELKPLYIDEDKILNECRKYLVETSEPIHDHFSIPHVGIEILSMSKRIMNEVICLAEDNNLNIYYQDTDSMHIDEHQVKILADKFKEKYGRDLIGKDMGQFHCDFDDKFEDGSKCDSVVSLESYYLGKKCYIDKLLKEGCNNKGYPKSEISFHIRMKGITSDSIRLYNDSTIRKGDCMKIYEKLYNDKKIKFDMLANPEKVRMQFNNDFSIENKVKFERVIFFGDAQQKKDIFY